MPEPEIYECEKCHRRFDTPNQLSFHLNRFRDTPKMTACELAAEYTAKLPQPRKVAS